MMTDKTAFMLTLCGAAAMSLSACGSKSEEPVSSEENAPDESIAAAAVAQAPAPASDTSGAAVEPDADKPGAPTPSVDDIAAKAIKPAEPVKEDSPARQTRPQSRWRRQWLPRLRKKPWLLRYDPHHSANVLSAIRTSRDKSPALAPICLALQGRRLALSPAMLSRPP